MEDEKEIAVGGGCRLPVLLRTYGYLGIAHSPTL